MLHRLEQYGMAVQRHCTRCHDIGRLHSSLLCLPLPRIAQVLAQQGKRGRGNPGPPQDRKVQQGTTPYIVVRDVCSH